MQIKDLVKKVDDVEQLLELNEMGNLLQKDIIKEILLLLYSTGINYQKNILRTLNLSSWHSLTTAVYRLKKYGFIKVVNDPSKNIRTKILLEMQQQDSLSRNIRLERLNRIIFLDLTNAARTYIKNNEDYFTRRTNFMMVKSIKLYTRSFSDRLKKLVRFEEAKKKIEIAEKNKLLTKEEVTWFDKWRKRARLNNRPDPFRNFNSVEGQSKQYNNTFFTTISVEEYKDKVKKYLELKQ